MLGLHFEQDKMIDLRNWRILIVTELLDRCETLIRWILAFGLLL